MSGNDFVCFEFAMGIRYTRIVLEELFDYDSENLNCFLDQRLMDFKGLGINGK